MAGCRYSARRVGAGLILISCHPGDWFRYLQLRGAPTGLYQIVALLPDADLVRCQRRARRCLPCRLNTAVRAEKPVPEIIDHREIAISIAVVNKMELLFSLEPRETVKP